MKKLDVQLRVLLFPTDVAIQRIRLHETDISNGNLLADPTKAL